MILWLENTSLFKISLYHPPPYTVFVLLSRAISGLLNCEQNWGLPLQWVRIRGIYFVLFACRDISVLWSCEGGFWEVRVDNNRVEEFFQFSFEIETTERDKGDFECHRSDWGGFPLSLPFQSNLFFPFTPQKRYWCRLSMDYVLRTLPPLPSLWIVRTRLFTSPETHLFFSFIPFIQNLLLCHHPFIYSFLSLHFLQDKIYFFRISFFWLSFCFSSL